MVGTSHLRAGLPCQDAYACTVLQLENGESLLLAVAADGASSAPRGAEGAALVCEEVLVHIPQLVASAGGAIGLEPDHGLRLFNDVRQAVFRRAEEVALPPRDFASTLLVALIGDRCAFYLQVGDGAIVLSRRDDPFGFGWVFWPDHGEYINETCFVTDDDAATSLRTEVAQGFVEEVAVFTDGIERLVLDYSTQMVHEPFFERMFRPLRQMHAAGHSKELENHLRAYLDSKAINDRTDDDKTLVLGTRRAPRI